LLKKEDFALLPKHQKQKIVEAELARIYVFQRWDDVLAELGLSYSKPDYGSLLEKAGEKRGGGEGPAHLKLKMHVCANPRKLGLPAAVKSGEVERPIASADRLDVLFTGRKLQVAAEVKASGSDDTDIIRGLFQCIKYKAVLEAMAAATGKECLIRTVLVLENKFPESLVRLRNILGVEVIENFYNSDQSPG